MASIVETAKAFFTSCETGKGWDGCKAFCKPDATFSAQAEPLADLKTLHETVMAVPSPQVRYEELSGIGSAAVRGLSLTHFRRGHSRTSAHNCAI
jgi:hypothetical protein